jgi:hypothetical protein
VTTFVEADFARAVAIVGGDADLNALTRRLGIDWDFLEYLALGVADEVSQELVSPLPQGEGADAFVAGFLIGIFLIEPRDSIRRIGEGLSRAVDTVRERGRHAVIAEVCDLDSVAAFETVYSESLALSLDFGSRKRMLESAVRLFESGLATGIVLALPAAQAET